MALPLKQFAAQTQSKDVLLQSTSGGAFTELALVILRQGGVVCAAGWEDRTFRVVHKWAKTESELADLRGTKYVLSDLSNVYGQMASHLRTGRPVLFVGTPCEVAAIKKNFGSFENLSLCGLICHSNLSGEIWERYVDELVEKSGCAIKSIFMRKKTHGWRNSEFVVEFVELGHNICERIYDNAYFNAFSIAPRAVCSHCPFRAGECGADVLIGDCWGVENMPVDLETDFGVSAVLAYTERGEDLVFQSNLKLVEVEYQQIRANNPYLERQYVPDARRRDLFMKYYRCLGVVRAVRIAQAGGIVHACVLKVRELIACLRKRR